MKSHKGSHARDKAKLVFDKVNILLDVIPSIKSHEITGSFLRGKIVVGDLDYLILRGFGFTTADLNPILDIADEILQQGDNKISIVIDDIQVDFLITEDEDYIFAKTFMIGSGSFNKRMRYMAKRKGYRLNEYGLYHAGTDNRVENINTEQDLFNKLNITYRKPNER